MWPSTFDPAAILLRIDLDVESLEIDRYHPVVTDDDDCVAQLLKREVLLRVLEQHARCLALREWLVRNEAVRVRLL